MIDVKTCLFTWNHLFFYRETVETYALKVKAVDKGFPKLTSFQTIKVTIADKNDNAPTFTEALSTIEVAENKPVGAFQIAFSLLLGSSNK